MEKLQTFDSLVSKNDFVIKFANVNGSGSASANQMFAKAVFRMGIPVSPKNIFPSNIQGLPTWFEIRINNIMTETNVRNKNCLIFAYHYFVWCN